MTAKLTLQRLLLLVWLLALPDRVFAQQECSGGGVCVEREDILMMVELARQVKCRAEIQPIVTTDPITIILDRQGRVFGSGTGDKPFKVYLDWCNYKLEIESQVTLLAAQRVEPDWGFRFRPKAALGVLTRELVDGRNIQEYGDVELMIEPIYYHWLNLNGFISFRSVGVGLGVDITTNFGVAVLLNTRWGEWRANPLVAAYFAF